MGIFVSAKSQCIAQTAIKLKNISDALASQNSFDSVSLAEPSLIDFDYSVEGHQIPMTTGTHSKSASPSPEKTPRPARKPDRTHAPAAVAVGATRPCHVVLKVTPSINYIELDKKRTVWVAIEASVSTNKEQVKPILDADSAQRSPEEALDVIVFLDNG